MLERKRNILVVTVGRSDYGICRPILERIEQTDGLGYALLVSGAHLSPRTGNTVEEIEAEARPIAARLTLPETDSGPEAATAAMGVAISAAASIYATRRPDILLVIGDRFEMFALTAAAVPFNIPIAHIHGGELSFGAIDDVFRHSITKMAHLHFAATEDYARRIARMGEEPWRITVSGAPGLDNLHRADLPDRDALARRFGLRLDRPPILITFHPVTRQSGAAVGQVRALLKALACFDHPLVFTAPNADAESDVIRAELSNFVAGRGDAQLVENFGSMFYLAMLRESAAVVGNSSSGLIETPAFALPTVNVGDRQNGRTRAANVIDVPPTEEAITRGITKALDPEFRKSLAGMTNPYGDGHAAVRIVDVLASVPLDQRLLTKRFYDG